MLKSIVILEISIDRVGNPIDVSIYRSNGFKHLELRALESVVRAAPFPAPAEGVLDGPGSVTFLETFLFRADDRFQLHSLVKPVALSAARR
ncbi:MAG TPA: TonB family protein [Burkholderiales bacterium]|nr:TonB family protein [Burkholderiales bacterium]